MSYNFGFRRPGQPGHVLNLKHRTIGDEIRRIEKLIDKAHGPDATLDDLFMLNAKLARRGQYGLVTVRGWIKRFDEIALELGRRKMNFIKYSGFLISWAVYARFWVLIDEPGYWFYKTGHLWFLKPNLRAPTDLKIHSPALRSAPGLLNAVLTEDGAWGYIRHGNNPNKNPDRFTFISYESIFESLSPDAQFKQPLADYLSKPRRRYRSKLKPYVPAEKDVFNLTEHWRYENHFRDHSAVVAFDATQDGKN